MEEKNYRVEKCLKCGKKEFDNDAVFCPECGTTLYNMCSSYLCKAQLLPTDKYCKYCGSASIFLNIGYFSPNDDDDLPF